MDTFKCSDCHKTITNTSKTTTGYGTYGKDKVCFSCCATRDLQAMRADGKRVLYLTGDSKQGYKLTNWPGTLSLTPTAYHIGKHNIAHTRIDVWFVLDGFWWHGVQYGEFTQLCHCKRTKTAYKDTQWDHPVTLKVDYPHSLIYSQSRK